MKTIFTQLAGDEHGFIVSAELILVSTIVVLGMIVGLAEVAENVNQELEDVGAAFACIQQSYTFSGNHGHKGCTTGSSFEDQDEFCGGQYDIVSTGPQSEGRGY